METNSLHWLKFVQSHKTNLPSTQPTTTHASLPCSTHALPNLPVKPSPNPTPPTLGALGLHDTAGDDSSFFSFGLFQCGSLSCSELSTYNSIFALFFAACLLLLNLFTAVMLLKLCLKFMPKFFLSFKFCHWKFFSFFNVGPANVGDLFDHNLHVSSQHKKCNFNPQTQEFRRIWQDTSENIVGWHILTKQQNQIHLV